MALEIRVHGIGNHKATDALGSPRLAPGSLPAKESREAVELDDPPARPRGHDLRLAVWARTSRRFSGKLWYLGLPYSLVNTAAAMAPHAGRRRALFLAVVGFSGWLLTIAAATWMLATTETLLAAGPAHVQTPPVQVSFVLVGIGLAFGLFLRGRNEKARPEARVVGWSHAVTVLVLTAVVVVWRPAARFVTSDGAPGWPTDCVTGEGCRIGGNLDLVTTVVLVTSALALCCCVALGVLGDRHGTVRERVAAGPGAALAIGVAFLLVHVFGSFGQYGAAALGRFMDQFGTWRGLAGELTAKGCLRWDAPCILLREDRVLSVQAPGGGISLSNVVALCGLFGLLAAALLFALGYRLTRVPRLPEVERLGDDAYERARLKAGKDTQRKLRRHAFVLSLPRVLAPLLVSALLVSVLIGWCTVTALDRGRGPGEALSGVHGWLQLGGVLVVVFFLVGRLPAVRAPLDRVADVLGFWPIWLHPFGGHSYRDEVVACLRQQVGKELPHGHVALVGHSQGSVVSAWLACRWGPDPLARERLHLVTCGSPLAALYATFFPAHFDEQFFITARSHVASWDNVWRPTDPIATRVPVPAEEGGPEDWPPPAEPRDDRAPGGDRGYVHNIDVPETGSFEVWGHSNYWTEDRQMTCVRDRLAAVPVGQDAVAVR
jgi:hypothetical protein